MYERSGCEQRRAAEPTLLDGLYLHFARAPLRERVPPDTAVRAKRASCGAYDQVSSRARLSGRRSMVLPSVVIASWAVRPRRVTPFSVGGGGTTRPARARSRPFARRGGSSRRRNAGRAELQGAVRLVPRRPVATRRGVGQATSRCDPRWRGVGGRLGADLGLRAGGRSRRARQEPMPGALRRRRRGRGRQRRPHADRRAGRCTDALIAGAKKSRLLAPQDAGG